VASVAYGVPMLELVLPRLVLPRLCPRQQC
jgi:hypothetical protein